MQIGRALVIMVFYGVAVLARADGLQDNDIKNVRPIPPPGLEISATDREVLEKGLRELGQHIARLGVAKDVAAKSLLPDVEIFHRAVREALELNQFFTPDEVKAGHDLLQIGIERANQLGRGQSPWTTQTGLVIRGYRSRIDRTVQPMGLVIPTHYQGSAMRLDIWLHGRGEKVSEVAFLNQRRRQLGQISPSNTIVLHPYGRYCNAFKFAGEIDVLESMNAVKQMYRIDEDRIAIRGFSMGGAGCWQLAVHYPDLWFAATPGAGFSETPEFLRTFQQEHLDPTPWEKTLWRWYDCTGYAINLFNCPTIAYSGELDSQKQAADIMERALAEEQLRLTHLIGPETKHAIHPSSGAEIERRLAALAAAGRERVPRHVQFATFTLKYHRSHWVVLNGLEKHWEQARVNASIVDDHTVKVETKNVTGFSLQFESGSCPFDLMRPVTVEVNGQRFEASKPETDRSWVVHWWRGALQPTNESPESDLHKRHDLQGPIDDAFLDTFILVRPTGRPLHEATGKWFQSELDRMVIEWRRHFRGDAIVKDDIAIKDADIDSAHLILFGDVQSNDLLRRIAKELPLKWNSQSLSLGGETLSASNHVPLIIYPNPLQPRRYVVVNSGFTFREYDYLNNARQVPRLPDWAAVDIGIPANSKYPGKVVAAGFFDERWK